MIQGLDQLQQAADYHFAFRRLRLFGLGLAAFGIAMGVQAWDIRQQRWDAASIAATALWIVAYAILLIDPLGRGWLRSRPFAGHGLLAAALLILIGISLASGRFAPSQSDELPKSVVAVALVGMIGAGSLAFYHWLVGWSLWGKRRPLPGMLKQLDEQIAAIKGGDIARDRSLVEFTTAGSGRMRAALRPGMVVLLGRGGHLLYYRRKQVAITPGQPGRATLQLADEQLEIAITPAMLERFRADGR